MKKEVFSNVRIAYMRRIGEYGAANERLMSELKDYLKEHPEIEVSTIVGIALDHPDTSASHKRYDAGFVVDESYAGALPTRLIDDGAYVIVEVEHTYEEVQLFWQDFARLMKEVNMDASRVVIERYTKEKIAAHRCEFCIPISK